MPRVTHVKSARKDNPVCKKGESYYWWKFRYGGKRFSLTRPRASQLTQSAYFSQLYSLQEMIEDMDATESEDLEGLRDDIASEVENLRDECQSNLDNMPESLQYSPTGELLQERIDACETAESALQDIDFSDFEPDIDEDKDAELTPEQQRAEQLPDWLSEKQDEMNEALSDCVV